LNFSRQQATAQRDDRDEREYSDEIDEDGSDHSSSEEILYSSDEDNLAEGSNQVHDDSDFQKNLEVMVKNMNSKGTEEDRSEPDLDQVLPHNLRTG
jgi:hypothetical protein